MNNYYDFIGKEFLQKNGDILRIIEVSSDKKTKDNHPYFLCKSLIYHNNFLALKQNILKGRTQNPEIEKIEFISKLWPQNCGDTLKILKKSLKKDNTGIFLWECEFIKYPCIVYKRKGDIIKGEVDNPNLPWKSKENLEKYILTNFKEKPYLDDVADSLGICKALVCKNIIKFNLKNLINYTHLISKGEKEIRDFVSNYLGYNVFNSWDELVSNKNCELEIDIYIPELKLGIEFDGKYWHSELFNGEARIKEKDEAAYKRGISLIHISQEDWEKRNDLMKVFIINNIEKRKLIHNVKL
jgi:hypothetical protein